MYYYCKYHYGLCRNSDVAPSSVNVIVFVLVPFRDYLGLVLPFFCFAYGYVRDLRSLISRVYYRCLSLQVAEARRGGGGL